MLRIPPKKALISAFFFCLLSGATLADGCLLPSPVESAQVASVTDGDTLRLTDGRKLRLLAIGAPEIDWENQENSEAFGLTAKKRLQWLLPKKSAVMLRHDRDKYDRFGRSLVQVINADGIDVGAELVKEGLAYTYIFPPNDGLLGCYFVLEKQARKTKAGIWSLPRFHIRPAATAPDTESGYQLLNGRISKREQRGEVLTLELDGRVRVKVRGLGSAAYAGMNLPKLGQTITVRGPLNWKQGRGTLDIRHRQGFDRP